MNSKFSFLSLLLLVLFSTQISYANDSAEALARKAVSENAAEASPRSKSCAHSARPV